MELTQSQSKIQQKDLSITEKWNSLCNYLENWRILLLAGFLLFQGCILVPTILLISSFYDIGITGVSVFTAALGTVAILVSNMAEASIKMILVIFITNLLLSLFLIGIHLVGQATKFDFGF